MLTVMGETGGRVPESPSHFNTVDSDESADREGVGELHWSTNGATLGEPDASKGARLGSAGRG
jgi:hypothetical protein